MQFEEQSAFIWPGDEPGAPRRPELPTLADVERLLFPIVGNLNTPLRRNAWCRTEEDADDKLDNDFLLCGLSKVRALAALFFAGKHSALPSPITVALDAAALRNAGILLGVHQTHQTELILCADKDRYMD
jgi:hypothetical protein